jgi:hypothetical protein
MDETGVMLSMPGSIKVLVSKYDKRDYRVRAGQAYSYRGGHTSEHSIWIECKLTTCGEAGLETFWREHSLPRRAIQRREVLLTDYVHTSSLESIS